MLRKRDDLTEMHLNCEQLRGSAPERTVEFVMADPTTVEGDPRLLRVAIDNLLRNSWKDPSSRSSARIEFGVQSRDGVPVYFVRDDGVGFADGHRDS